MTRLPAPLKFSLDANPAVKELLADWRKLDFPGCWLVAGAVVQSYWNAEHGLPALHGVSDLDVIYFDPDDLSAESESRHAARIRRLFEHLPVRFDLKNEARVHLWYEDKFGYRIEPYTSATDAIDTFPTTAGAIGVRNDGTSVECYAYVFHDLLNLVVRPNKRQITRSIYEAKVARWRLMWPGLNIVNWNDA